MTNQDLSRLARSFGVIPYFEEVQIRIREDFQRLSSAGNFRQYFSKVLPYRPARAQKRK